MRFLPDMFKAASGYKRFTLLVATSNDTIVFQHADADDESPRIFVQGDAVVTIGEALKCACPNARVVTLGSKWFPDLKTDDPFAYGFIARRWSKLADTMNGKGVKCAKESTRFEIYDKFFLIPYLEYDHDSRKWVVTSEGMLADRLLDLEEGKADPS